MTELEERIEKARDEADCAFWNVIAKRFPEIKTGDVFPYDVIIQQMQQTEWIHQWIQNNIVREYE